MRTREVCSVKGTWNNSVAVMPRKPLYWADSLMHPHLFTCYYLACPVMLLCFIARNNTAHRGATLSPLPLTIFGNVPYIPYSQLSVLIIYIFTRVCGTPYGCSLIIGGLKKWRNNLFSDFSRLFYCLYGSFCRHYKAFCGFFCLSLNLLCVIFQSLFNAASQAVCGNGGFVSIISSCTDL